MIISPRPIPLYIAMQITNILLMHKMLKYGNKDNFIFQVQNGISEFKFHKFGATFYNAEEGWIVISDSEYKNSIKNAIIKTVNRHLKLLFETQSF